MLLGGVYNGVTFAYLSTDEDLKVVTEIFDWPEGLVQQPDSVIPRESRRRRGEPRQLGREPDPVAVLLTSP